MIESGIKVKTQNLPNLLKKYEGSTVTATGTKGVSGETQMFKTMDGGAIFLTEEQVSA